MPGSENEGQGYRKLLLHAESNTRGMTKWPISIRAEHMEEHENFTDGVFYVPFKRELTLENIIVPPYYEFAKRGKLILTIINGGYEQKIEYNFNKNGREPIPDVTLKGGYALSAYLEVPADIAENNFGSYHGAAIHLLFTQNKKL
jgi:hypothetical protein